jgi:hypothetical protein
LNTFFNSLYWIRTIRELIFAEKGYSDYKKLIIFRMLNIMSGAPWFAVMRLLEGGTGQAD